MTLGEAIRNYRIEHDMSMDEFARRSTISKAYISILENNKHPKTGKPVIPTVTTYKNAADAMGISINELIDMVEDNVQFPNDNNELQELINLASKLSAIENEVLQAFNGLDETRKQQAISYIKYLLSEQNSEKRRISVKAT